MGVTDRDGEVPETDSDGVEIHRSQSGLLLVSEDRLGENDVVELAERVVVVEESDSESESDISPVPNFALMLGPVKFKIFCKDVIVSFIIPFLRLYYAWRDGWVGL